MASAPRLHWVDHAKAIGIVLVVVGHTAALPAEVREFIYRFHMPLFFFLAGVLARPERLAEGFGAWLTRQTRALVIPFLGFFAISWGWWLLIRNVGDKAKESAGLAWWAPLNGLLWGTGETLFVNPPLWFFPALFVTSVAFWGLWRVLPKRDSAMTVAVLGMVLLASLRATNLDGRNLLGIPPFRLWWNIDLLPWLLAFFGAGYLFRKGFLPEWKPGVWHMVKTLGAFLIILFGADSVVDALDPFDLNGREFGNGSGLTFFLVLFAALPLFLLIEAIPPNPITARLSRDTILIFPLHGLWFSVFSGVLSKVFHRGDWKETGGWAAVAVYTVGAIGLSLVVAPLLRRWVPWLVGGR
jgi:acyltransferase